MASLLIALDAHGVIERKGDAYTLLADIASPCVLQRALLAQRIAQIIKRYGEAPCVAQLPRQGQALLVQRPRPRAGALIEGYAS